MKRRILLLLSVSFVLTGNSFLNAQSTIDVRSNGFTFSPDEIVIGPGDTINFNIGSFHDAVEVSEETWNNNGTTSNGGFQFPLGGGKLVLNELGTYYFVCTPHADLGMKGIIYVEEPSSVSNLTDINSLQFNVFPNPASQNLNLSFRIENSTEVRIELFDFTGKSVTYLVSGFYPAGVYTESFSLNNLNSGRYMIHVRTDTESRIEPLVIID